MEILRHIGMRVTNGSLFVRIKKNFRVLFFLFFFFRNTREIVTFILRIFIRAEIVSLRAMFMHDYNPLIS